MWVTVRTPAFAPGETEGPGRCAQVTLTMGGEDCGCQGKRLESNQKVAAANPGNRDGDGSVSRWVDLGVLRG